MNKLLSVYTDGSVNPNPGMGGWAFVVVYGDEVIDEDSGFNPYTTNNIMELTAIIEALHWLLDNKVDKAIIYTDSQYAQMSITEWFDKWMKRKKKNKKNLDLIKEAVGLYKSGKFEIKWIRSHNGNKWNDRANDLALDVVLDNTQNKC